MIHLSCGGLSSLLSVTRIMRLLATLQDSHLATWPHSVAAFDRQIS
jgi:hypothetical protein